MLQFEIIQMDAIDEDVLRQVPQPDVVRLPGKRIRLRCRCFRGLLRLESFDPVCEDAQSADPQCEKDDLPPIAVLISQKQFLLRRSYDLLTR